MLQAGDTAPDFTLLGPGRGHQVTLTGLLKAGPVVSVLLPEGDDHGLHQGVLPLPRSRR